MDIKHERWGRVEGVELKLGCKSTWEKHGAEYFADKGWREVKPTRRDVTGEVSVISGRFCDSLRHRDIDVDRTEGYRLEKVTMYDLPGNWIEMWFPQGHAFAAWTWQFKRPCIIITKEE